VYDVQIVGYPERMRAYNARLKASRSERIMGDEAPPPVRTSRPPGRTPRPRSTGGLDMSPPDPGREEPK
jgi:hypothetical protein